MVEFEEFLLFEKRFKIEQYVLEFRWKLMSLCLPNNCLCDEKENRH